MNVLVTGANGFLGRHVVAELLRRGHQVRAMVRPATDVSRLRWPSSVELFRADLRGGVDLEPAFDGIDALIHLAATVVGGEDAQLSETVVGTTRLLRAMEKSRARRLVLASSFSVYDFNRAWQVLNESTPLESRLYERDGYAIAKTWQERVVRSLSESNGWQLTVLRPGFIWGSGNDYLACLGQSFGPVHLVFGPATHLPLTHVANCADCFATALELPEAIGQTINVVDDDSVTAWQYMRLYLRGRRKGGIRVPLPYALCLAFVKAAQRTSKLVYRGKGKLPSLLVPIRFVARFKPLRYPTRSLKQVLGWKPPLDLAACIERTWPTSASRSIARNGPEDAVVPAPSVTPLPQ